MKKVGIITHYYLSYNYGGNLQAYALATYINKMDGFSAEQICYDFSSKTKTNKSYRRNGKKTTESFRRPIYSLKNSLHNIKKRINNRPRLNERVINLANRIWFRKFNSRVSVVTSFNQNVIPHSDTVYDKNSIINCDQYHIYITGSDQVWAGCSEAFSLGFVHNQTKISYAASLGRNELPTENKAFLKEKIKDYTAVSVRDEDDKRIVSDLTDKTVEIVLDPVFLLDADEWNQVALKQNRASAKYAFCYFLGDNKKQKKTVEKFCHARNLKLVVIPHFQDNTNSVLFNDLFWGDIKPYDVDPSEFLSLIRDAEYVFTDSFHAMVFSIVFHKEFFAFRRTSKYGDMNSRLINLLKSMDLLDRFCTDNKLSCDYLSSLKKIDYEKCEQYLQPLREESKMFLRKNLSK